MRSLWTAVRRATFGALTVAAPGCGYENPGFMLKDSNPETGSAGSATNVTDVTVTTDPEMTSTPTTSTGMASEQTSTSGGPGVSGSETSTSTTGELTSTTSTETTETTGSGSWFFPTDCKPEDMLKTEWADAAADTFFLNELPQGLTCSFPESPVMEQCMDLEFSKSQKFSLYSTDGGDSFKDDFMSVFAMRFAQPSFIYEDDNGKILIPPEVFVGVELKFNVFHGDAKVPWKGSKLDVLRFGGSDPWSEEGGSDFTKCKLPAASFRCQTCPEGGGEAECMDEWSTEGQPIPEDGVPLKTLSIMDKPPPQGTEMLIDGLFKEDLPWLIAEGLMVFPAVNTDLGMLEVKSKDYPEEPLHPGLRAYYCQPEYTP